MLQSKRKRTLLVPVLALPLAIFIASSFSTDAEAQSRICRQLELDLQTVSGSSQRGTSQEYRRFDNAVREQTVQLNRTKKLSRRNRCGFGIFQRRGAQCGRINDSIQRMEANLDSLKRQRARYAPQQLGSSRARDSILRQLQRNGCVGYASARQEEQNPRVSRRRTLLEQIFGVRTYDERGGGGYLDGELSDEYGYGNTFRTLCVRKSDGYYFPISFSTRPEFFERDEQRCQAMCPSASVGLYHHRMPGEDSEQMVEFGTQQPYSTKPFAFAYRKEIDTANSCRFATTEPIRSASYDQSGQIDLNSNEETRKIGIPVFREDPNLIPDDYDNQKVGFSLEVAQKYLDSVRNPQSGDAMVEVQKEKNVRIVGPAFFPVQ